MGENLWVRDDLNSLGEKSKQEAYRAESNFRPVALPGGDS